MKNNNLSKEVSFKVSAKTYAQYKKYCEEQKVIPAMDLRRYITEKAASSDYIFGESVNFMALNMHMKNTEKYNVPFDGDEEQRIDEIADYLVNEAPDVACLNEFAPTEKGKRLVERLEKAGYKIIYPVSEMDYEKCKKCWCVTILAIKKDSDLSFEPKYDTSDMFPKYRFVAGVLSNGRGSIMISGVHVPCVDDDNNHYKVERKDKALEYLKDFKERFSDKEVLYFGDFNETFKDKDIFGGMVDVTEKKATYEVYGIDKFIATSGLVSHCTCSTVDDSPRSNDLTDHCAIKMVIK